ncbi:MAG: Wadjet anti-phage system protein JetD domain-containing protein [Bdellovibrio bacteriovorus]
MPTPGSEVARALLVKLLAQVDRGGRDTLPIGERSASDYFAVTDLTGRDAIHAYLENAEAAGAVTLEWGRRAAAQDLQRIRVKDADRLAAWLGVSRASAQAGAIEEQLAPLIAEAPDWLRDAYAEALAQWRLGGSPFRVAAADTAIAIRLFRVARAVAAGDQEGLDLRRFSVQLLGDSKAVESILGRLGALLRQNPDWSHWETDAELFQALGLEKFPPPLFIRGPLSLDYGGVPCDLTPLRPYVALSPDAVTDIRPTSPVPYLLTIENLASFQRHVREVRDQGVVIYTAGFPAPALVRVLGRLDQCLPTDCPFYHWGDRDPGGLRIYAKVNSACPAHGLSPHLMTVPDPGPSGWTRDQRRALEQVIARGGTAGRLAEAWIAQGLGPQEQEGLDPKAPGEEGCQAGAAVP